MNRTNNKLLAVLVMLILLTVGLAIGNTYIYLSRVKEIQNSLLVLQGYKAKPGPQGSSGLNGLRGEPGIQGPTGPQGLQGPQGTTGIQGTQGLQGPQGEVGDTGPVGPEGAQGQQGIQGDPGTSGREVEFQCKDDKVQWRYVGDTTWQDLYTLGATERCTDES